MIRYTVTFIRSDGTAQPAHHISERHREAAERLARGWPEGNPHPRGTYHHAAHDEVYG